MPDPLKYALRLIQMRSRSVAEVKAKLTLKKYSADQIQKTLAWLTAQGFLDDKKFAASFVEGRLRFRPRGKIILRMELKKKGISDEVINQTLSDLDPNAEQTAIKELVRIKAKRYQHLDPETRRNRLIALLSRRGYSWSQIKAVLD